jgi:hypothetical protein
VVYFSFLLVLKTTFDLKSSVNEWAGLAGGMRKNGKGIVAGVASRRSYGRNYQMHNHEIAAS